MKNITLSLKQLVLITFTFLCCNSPTSLAEKNENSESLEELELSNRIQANIDDNLAISVFNKIKDEYVHPIDNINLIKGCNKYISNIRESEFDVSNTYFQNDKKAEFEIFKIVNNEIESNKHSDIHQRTLGCIKGMLSILDNSSYYMEEDDFKLLTTPNKDIAGIGLEIEINNGAVRVTSPIEDSPAQLAGVKPNDIIRSIDDSTQDLGIDLKKTASLLRGMPGTTVKLTLDRQGEREPITLLIQRSILKSVTVKSDIPKEDYGYIRLIQFRDQAGQNIAKAINELNLKNKRPLKGIILDLRNNPGGLLNEAVAVASVFLPKDKLIVTTKGRTKAANMKLTSNRVNYILDPRQNNLIDSLPDTIKSIPLIILINNKSSGASEIVAGALQDYKRATVMGTPSYGRGSLQTIFPTFKKTALKLTTAKIYTPLDHSFDSLGISPDVLLTEEEGLSAALDYLSKIAN